MRRLRPPPLFRRVAPSYRSLPLASATHLASGDLPAKVASQRVCLAAWLPRREARKARERPERFSGGGLVGSGRGRKGGSVGRAAGRGRGRRGRGKGRGGRECGGSSLNSHDKDKQQNPSSKQAFPQVGKRRGGSLPSWGREGGGGREKGREGGCGTRVTGMRLLEINGIGRRGRGAGMGDPAISVQISAPGASLPRSRRGEMVKICSSLTPPRAHQAPLAALVISPPAQPQCRVGDGAQRGGMISMVLRPFHHQDR